MSNVVPAITPIDEARSELRTHLFVAASLASEGGTAPVNIRNMSPTGALIESATLPEQGAAVVLKRGNLEIAGRIAWKAGRRGGIAFSSTVSVADWLPRKAGSGQARIDRIVSDYKAGAPGPHLEVAADLATGNGSVAAELLALRTELAQLGDSLIGDGVLVANHPEIQILDIAVQQIDRIVGRMGGPA